MGEKKAKLEELMKDEAFLDALFSKKSSEEIQKLLVDNGLELTAEEIEVFATTILQGSPAGNEELSESALDSVAGGLIVAGAMAAFALGALTAYYSRKKK